MSDCIFCKIVKKQIAASIVYEDDQILAFHDTNPQAPTHILIIPREHIATTNNLTTAHHELIGKMVLIAQQIARQKGISEQGYRLVINCNRAGGQAVYHIHLHLLGGRRMGWPPG